MWSIKFLSGPDKSKEYLLPNGLIVLGRDKNCQIPLHAGGVSKKHAQITVDNQGKLSIKDLNSRNGVFLNGKQIREVDLKEGDRVGLYNVVFEIRKKNPQKYAALAKTQQQSYMESQFISSSNSNARISSQTEELDGINKIYKSFQKLIENYLHAVILPGIYKLAEWADFRLVVGGFILIFVVLVTILSSIPLSRILKSSVEQESKNHAESIANTIAQLNRKPFKEGLHTALNVDFALRRPGVKKAFIINAVNGRILAPAESAHLFPKEPFIHRARKLDRSTVERVDHSTIGAVVPMSFYNPQTGTQAPTAYSVVMYDMSTLAIGNPEILSLLFQNLFIAAILGLFLFFFLINLIHFPIHSINNQLNQALKEDLNSSVSTNYQSEILNELCQSINSALNQISLGQSAQSGEINMGGMEQHRQNEMTNVVEIIGFPALSVNLTDNTVASLNSSFKDQVTGLDEILYQSLTDITDMDFKESLKSLIEQTQMNPEDISFGEVMLNGMELQTTCQFIKGVEKAAYAIITFIPNEEAA